MKRRAIQHGEVMAIDWKSVQRDADGIFVLFSPDIPENEYRDGVAIVSIRGPLDHHPGCGDSYDAIRERVKEAFECDEAQAVILRIDSPGGAVSGLYDTVRAIRGMAEASDKRCVTYIDERSFSAAYALSCGSDEIVIPPSGLTGSIGVISTMADQVERDKAEGYNFVTITSGARKADGHIHVPISKEAEDAERARVDELAMQFFQEVKASRGLPIKAIHGFQAGLFLGQGAVDAGVADRVLSFDELYAELCQSGTSQLDTYGTRGSASKEEARMKAYRSQLIEQLKAAKALVATATGTDKVRAEVRVETLAGQLEAYKKVTEKHVEHSKTHEEDEGDEDEDGNETDRGDDEEGDEKKDDKKEASAAKKPMKAAAKSKKSEEDEDEEEARYESEDEEEALAALVQRAEGPGRVRALAALHSLRTQASAGTKALKLAQQLQAQQERDSFVARVDAAASAQRLTPNEAKRLRAGKDVEGNALSETDRGMYLNALLHGRPKSIVFANRDDLPVPAPIPNSLQGQLPDDLKKQIDMATASIPGLDQEAVLEDFNKRMNGAGKRGDV